MARQNICLLGATGSIGRSTLDVLGRHPDLFRVFAVTAHQRLADLLVICRQYRPRFAVVADALAGTSLAQSLLELGLDTHVLVGKSGLIEVAAHPDVDAVMAAIVGAAGLEPCLAAARAGKRLLLANKEALVVGGQLFMDAVTMGQAELLPIDSEHSAIFQCLPLDRREWPSTIDHIVLTASGGPFRERDPQTLREVTPEQACAHPNWVMGRKISVDSATMMNKALEVIEARWLFALAPSQIRVVVHPQSVIHSMVVCRDRSVLAQLGTPDMKVPIAVGLAWPQRVESGASALQFETLGALTFEVADKARYPGLPLAWDVLAGPQGSAAVLNAANEVAVAAFLARRIRFDQIHAVNADVIGCCIPSSGDAETLEGLLALDGQARRLAGDVVARLQR